MTQTGGQTITQTAVNQLKVRRPQVDRPDGRMAATMMMMMMMMMMEGTKKREDG